MILHLIFCFSLVSFSSTQLCRGNQFNYFDSCLDSCPQNTIPQLIFGASRCIQCDITKFKRLNSNETNCQCAIQTFQLKNSDQCVPCHYSCITCNGTSNFDCLTCDTPNPTTFRVKKGNTCLCLEGYFESELLSVTCLKCHSSCQTCSGPTESDCLSCAQGRIKDQIGDCVCSNGFVMNEQGQCSCPFPVSSDNVCRNQVTQCGFGQVQDVGKNIANIGRRGGAISCVCQPGLYRIRGSCGSCGLNEVYNQKKRKCQCQKGAQKFDGRCIICPSNQIFNKKTGECNCKKNQQLTEKGTCIRCPPKSVYQNGQCSCVFNYYSGSSGACRRCSKKSNHPSCMEQVHGIDRQRKLAVDQIIKKSNRS